MRGKTKLVSLASMLAVLLTVSGVFASGLVDVSKMSLFSGPLVGPLQSTANVFVNPAQIVKDYSVDAEYRIGGTFAIYIDIAGVEDLYSYQVNVTWYTGVLNFTGIVYDEFLARTVSPDGTSRIEDIYAASNETGYGLIAETILSVYPGITGSGRLVAVQFQIVGYGSTNITVGTGGLFPTTLLDSAGVNMTFTTADGYFRNTLPGDIQGDAVDFPPDGDVDYYDFLAFAAAYLQTLGQPGYNREADLQGDDPGTLPDGDIDYYDFLVFAANYLKTVSLP